MRESQDGFVLAEKDLEIRGPGEVLGTDNRRLLVSRCSITRARLFIGGGASHGVEYSEYRLGPRRKN